MKAFLMPKCMRRGSPILHFVVCEKKVVGEGYNYSLGTYYDLKETGKYHGDHRDYDAVRRVTISQILYDQLTIELKANHKRYQEKVS
jgi:hypothetical protein